MENTDMNAFCGGGTSEPLNSRGCKSQKICYNSDIYNHKYNGGFMKKFFAFTLAEVLITLGVIGVVAALTIPTLISQHQKKVYVTQFEKAYNTITNAFRLMQAETGSDNLDDNDFITALTVNSSSNEAEVTRLAKKYFNIAQDVKYYNSRDIEGDYKFLFYNNGSNPVFIPYLYGYLLKTVDGADIYLNCYSEKISVAIDVNGSKRAPNTSGRDLFVIFFDLQGRLEFTSVLAHGVAPVCSPGASGNHEPSYCSDRVIQEGWQMNY